MRPLSFDECRRSHRHCFLCGTENPDSFGLHFEAVAESVVAAKFVGTQCLQGYSGYLHGGIISSLLDCAMVHCLFHRGVKGVTTDLTVKFRKRIEWGRELVIRGELLSARLGLYSLRSEINADGEIMAEARARFLRRDDL